MGAYSSPAGHLCIDLSNVHMTGNEQRELLHSLEATVVSHLSKLSVQANVVTITLSPNNGMVQPEVGAPANERH